MSSRPVCRSAPWLVVIAVATACAGPPSGQTQPASTQKPSSSAAAFFADPPLSHVRLSPAGERITGVTSRDGTRVLIDKSLAQDEIRYLGKFVGVERAIHDLGWVGDGRIAILLEAEDPRNASLPLDVVVFNPSRWRPSRTDRPWRLPASPGAAGSAVLDWLPDDPDEWIVSWFDVDDRVTSVRRLRVHNGTGTVVSVEGLAARRWFVDARGRARAAVVMDEESPVDVVYARADAESEPTPLFDEHVARADDLEFAGFTPDANEFYVYATTEAGRRGLYRYDRVRGERVEEVAAHPRFDVGALHYTPGSDRLRSVEILGDRPELLHFDDSAAREQAAIDATFPAETSRIVSSSRSGDVNLVEVSGATSPPRTYVYERAKREMSFLFASLPALDRVQLSPMHAVSFPARDGLEIPAYLVLPPGFASLDEARDLPAIVIAHDGPTDRVSWGWDARAAFLASRGFAVLLPNFRGSDGYGRGFEKRGFAEWGGAMEHDLVDGVAWLVERGIADADRIGIFGVGYGGYAALMGPIVAPGVFRAAASWAGISDLLAFFEAPPGFAAHDPNHPVEWGAGAAAARLEALSPLHRADEISVPVLLAHGGADKRIPISQSRALADAIASHGGSVEPRWYRDEAHAFRAEENRIDFHEALARFFDTHLQPRDAL